MLSGKDLYGFSISVGQESVNMRLLHKSRRGGRPQTGSSSPFVTSALALEGLAVGALINGRVCLMRTYRDAVQCAVFRTVTMICALRNSAADRLIALRMIHGLDLLCWFAVIMPAKYGFIPNLACRIIKAPN